MIKRYQGVIAWTGKKVCPKKIFPVIAVDTSLIEEIKSLRLVKTDQQKNLGNRKNTRANL